MGGGGLLIACTDPENLLGVPPYEEMGSGSDKVLPFQNPYPGKSRGFDIPVQPHLWICVWIS